MKKLSAWIVTVTGHEPLLVASLSGDDARYRALLHLKEDSRARTEEGREPRFDKIVRARALPGVLVGVLIREKTRQERALDAALRLGASTALSLDEIKDRQ